MKKFVNKFLAVAVAFVTAVAMMPFGSGNVAYAAESPITENVKYFSTTMYNFDQDTFNTVTDNNYGEKKESNFYFIGDNSNGNWNTWQKGRVNHGLNTDNGNTDGKYNVLVQGIVKNTLDSSGNIQFNYKNAGVFASPQTKIAGRDVYQNVQFPFVYTNDGYYTFDSESNHVHSGKVDGETLNLYKNGQIIRDKGTFFPFNEDSDTKADYHFGMSMSVPFYMNENGTLENGQNMKFEFSGDDDVWVFINGKLVLDLGGVHGAIGGNIDFATGEIEYTHSSGKVYAIQGNSSLSTKQEIQDKKVKEDLYKNFGITRNELASGENNLQIFYLERGCSESNCKIRFNLLQKDTLEVSKTLGTKTPYTDEKFQFQLLKKNSNNEYEPVSEKVYTLYNGSSLVDGKYTTDEYGNFNLQAGQRANFTDNPSGDYRVVEITDGYDTEWTLTKENNPISGKVDGQNAYNIPIAKNELGGITKYTLNCVNYAEVKLIDDTIVLDYGKPVQYNVRNNDTSQSKKDGISVYGIGESSLAKDETTAVGYTTLNTDVALNNGNIKINSDGFVTYTPTRYMSSVDKANYAVKYQVNNGKTDEYAYATVNVLPATSVYYEDDFGTTGNTDSEVSIVWGGSWGPVSNETPTVEDKTQSSTNDRYGWDDSYKDNLGYSNDSATKTDEKGATATFTFTGTGVDVYSRTNGNVGLICAQLYSGKGVLKEDEKTPKAAIGIQYIDNISTSGDYYQIPTLSFENLNYGTYTVVITAGAMGTGTAGTYYLDGIRVYNPLQGNATAEKAYDEAGESNAQYIKLRDTLLESGFGFIEEGETSVKGSVFIDNINGDSVTDGTKDDYEKYGPKNEVYLAKGQAIAFEIEGYEDAVTKPNLFIGLKALDAATQVTFTNGTDVSKEPINSSSDLYYRVTPTSSGKVIIRNTGENLLSITKLRITNTNATVALVSSQSLLSYAQEFDSLKVVENTDKDDSSDNDNKDEILDKDDVDIDNPSDNDNNQGTNNSIWNIILNYIKNWFKK